MKVQVSPTVLGRNRPQVEIPLATISARSGLYVRGDSCKFMFMTIILRK